MTAALDKIALRFKGVSHRFLKAQTGAESVPYVLREVDFELRKGEIICIVGASGCGKTTVLNLAAGLLAPTEGTVYASGRPVAGPGVDRAMMFQQDTLFPWLTVRGNIAFALHCRNACERLCEVDRVIQWVGLSGFENYLPTQLSGGMRQRVALARALINHAQVLLLDEPFASLDALTRESMQELVLEMHERLQPSILMVTHDIDEAVFMADRVIVMSHEKEGGRIIESVQTGLPYPRTPELREYPRVATLRKNLRNVLKRLTVSRESKASK